MKGSVIDASNNESVVGATVVIKGTTRGTITDADGKFELDASPNDRLEISFIGMKTQEIQVGNGKRLSIQMESDAKQMEEVVVVGYGSQKKKDLTGGVVSLSGAKLEAQPTTSVAQRLQGQVSGMTVTSSDARPGSSATINVRGVKSLSGGNAPLIVLDGIPFNGSMNEIDQNSVENISVLKDASAAAIYGARAANGVILITSKKGKIGKPVVTYSGYGGFQSAYRMNLMKGSEYITLLEQYYRDRGTDPSYWQHPETFLQTSLLDNYKNGVEHDWQDAMYQNAFQQEHQVSISGATDATHYYASLSYLDQDGVIKYTQYKKYAATINLSQKLGDVLTIGVNTQMSQQDNGGVRPQYEYGYRMSPYANVVDANNQYVRYPMWTETLYNSPFANQNGTNDNMTRSIYTGWYADVKLPIKGLSYRSNFGFSFRANEQGSYFGSNTMSGEPVSGVAAISNATYVDWTFENILKYTKDFGLHHLDATGLMSAQQTQNQISQMSGQGFINDHNTYHNMDAASGEKSIGSSKTATALASYMGRVNYNYASRYLLTLTGRYDGYSAFGTNNKWAFFPSIAGGWVLTEESFMKNLHLNKVDLLKLRLSYGANGNQAVSPYQTLSKMTQADYIYGDGSSFSGGVTSGYEIGNNNLKWETTYSFNAGLDFGFFNNRLSGSLDVYQSNTKDLLMRKTVPSMNGYNTIMSNVGETQNRGLDLTLNSHNVEVGKFRWGSTFIFSENTSKIVALRGDGQNDIANKWFIGSPISVNYDYKAIGVWQTSEKAEATKYHAVPGDAKIYDANGDGKITSADRVIIGSRIPKYTMGLTNNFSYGNWSLSVFFNGVFSVSKQNNTLLFERSLFGKNLNTASGLNYWTPENPSTEATRLNYQPVNGHAFYMDASFIRLQDINLSYNIPSFISSKLKMQKMNVYIDARNLMTFSKTNKYGVNPEENIIGAESSASYPVAHTFVLGVNVTF